ncbi:MAG: AhpC/TSA family protein [Rhodobacter sp.]|nr:AhpC/TSA family protein [Rhodobacter sp.]
MTMKLMPNTKAPTLNVPLVGGGTWSLADQLPETFTMVLFYRGLHCPVCKGYLGKLESLMDAYTDAGFSVLAVSMNDQATAKQSVADWGLGKLPVGYGLDAATAQSWGLYLSEGINEVEAQMFVEPGTFWIRPDGTLYLIDIANMPWPRPDLEFLLSKIPLIKERNYPARGGYTG